MNILWSWLIWWQIFVLGFYYFFLAYLLIWVLFLGFQPKHAYISAVSSSLHYKADFSGEPLKDSGIDTGHSSSSQTLNEDSSKVHRYCIYVLSILGNFEEKKKNGNFVFANFRKFNFINHLFYFLYQKFFIFFFYFF